MNSKTKVSVIIPLYNAEKYMDVSISSVINQSYTNLEIILVNDGSTDNTAILCERYKEADGRILVTHQNNGGPGVARNNGLEKATGEFICFVDSDDRLDALAIETMLQYIDEDTDMIQCQSVKVYDDCKIDEEPWGDETIEMDSQDAMVNYLYSVKPIVRFSVWAKLIRRSTIGDLRFPEMNNSEDVVFNAYLINACRKIKYIPSTLYFVTVRQGSISRGSISRNRIESSNKCNEMILKLLQSEEKYSELLPRGYWSLVATMLINACQIYKQRDQNWREDIKYIKKCLEEIDVPPRFFDCKKKILMMSFRIFPFAFVALGQRIIEWKEK